MVSSSFLTFLVFLLLYVPVATIAKKRKAPSAKKKAWEDPVPCKNFYDKGQNGSFRTISGDKSTVHWRGGTNADACEAVLKHGHIDRSKKSDEYIYIPVNVKVQTTQSNPPQSGKIWSSSGNPPITESTIR